MVPYAYCINKYIDIENIHINKKEGYKWYVGYNLIFWVKIVF